MSYIRYIAEAYLKVDLRTLGIFRFVFGLVCFFDIYRRIGYIDTFYSEVGFTPLSLTSVSSFSLLSLFNIDRDKKVELKSGIFNRFKSEKQETKDIPQPELFTYENIQDTEDISDFEADAQKETFETALDEKPYIEDSKQFSFYLTRNMKTFFTLLAISVLIVRGFRLFLDSMKIIIDNLL